MRHNGQKSAKSRFGMKAVRFVVLGIITLVVALAQTSGAVKAHDLPDYVCFPSCSAVDGRFLVINQSSSGPSFAGNKIDIELSVAASDTSFSWGVFDADATGLWDDSLAAGTAGAILRYELYADPAGDGSGTFLVDSFTADAAFLAANPGVVLDNKWYDRTINNVTYSTNPSQSAQASDSDNYHYHLRIVSTNTTTFGGASVPNGNSAFKIRTSGALGIAPQAFAYIGQLHTNVSAEVSTIYPASGGTTSGTLTPTTYDGTWEFAFFVPSGVTQINLWDGDMDYGNKDCTKPQDTDDPDTPHDYKDPLTGAFITPWTNNAAPAGASNQGVAVGSACASGTGSGNNTGAPSDDSAAVSVRRSPSFGSNVVYKLVGPDGVTSWQNLNPSGNVEWEKFTIDADPNTPFDRSKMDYKVASLDPGVYRTHVEGVDLQNLCVVFQLSHAGLYAVWPASP